MGWTGSKQPSRNHTGGSFSKEATANWGRAPSKASSDASRSAQTPARLSSRYIVIAGVALVVLVGVVTWWLMQDLKPKSAPSKSGTVAEASTAKSKQPRTTKPVPAKTNEVARASSSKPATVEEPPAQEKTPEELEAEARAKDPLYDRHHIVAAKPLVAEAADQLIVTIFSTDLGDMPPFIPPLSSLDEEKTMKAIDKLEKASADDTPEAREAKEIVNAVKKELKKFLDEGGTVNGFLSHYANELQSAFEERKTCQELLSKSIRSDDPEVAREVYRKYNEHLAQKGIKPLKLNRRQREYLGIKEDEP